MKKWIWVASLLWGNATGQVLREAFVQRAGETEITICWRTMASEIGVVKFGPAPGEWTGEFRDDAPTQNHEIRIQGLKPETRYYYAYGNASTLYDPGDASRFFKTLPPKGSARKLRFWTHGDMGSYNERQTGVLNSFMAFNGGADVDGWLILGDVVYRKGGFNDGSDTLYTSEFFNTYKHLLKNTVAWPSPGNHDYLSVFGNSGPYYDAYVMPKNGESGGEPSGTEEYYSFDIGNVHLVSLNSELYTLNGSSTSPQAEWLRRDLAASDAKWKIVYWHQPPYSKGSHNSDDLWEVPMRNMRAVFLPIVESYGVDLALTGHSHNYERSCLINGHYGYSSSFVPSLHLVQWGDGAYPSAPYVKEGLRGTLYAVFGCGGKLNTGDGSLNHPVMVVSQDTVAGSGIIDIDGDTLRVRFLSMNGQILDDFAIVKPEVTALEKNNFASRFHLFPNPISDGHLYYGASFARPERITVEIFDPAGKLVLRPMYERVFLPGAHEGVMDVRGLAKGTYTAVIGSSEYRRPVKFTVIDR